MISYTYEAHELKGQLLPFIFHRNHSMTQNAGFPHWHENIELLYCIRGSGYVKCGPETTHFSCGEIFVVNTDTPHSIGSDTTIEYRCLIIGSSFCAANGVPISALSFQQKICDERLNTLFEAVREAFDCSDSQDFLSVMEIHYRVLGLLRVLCANYIDSTARKISSPANEYVKKALIYIRNNLSSNLSLQELASHIGISKYHLSHIFKDFTGKSIVETVNHFRCQEAKLLIENGMPVSAAAASCGFKNLSYFSHAFKRIFHSTPSSFSKTDDPASNFNRP